MNLRVLGIIGGLVGLVLVAWAAWYLASPLFIDNTVDEAFPVTSTDTETTEDMADSNAEAVAADDPMPEEVAEGPVVLQMGEFIDGEGSYSGSGTATIYELPDGERILRFEDFTVTNGPGLEVLLSPTAQPVDGEYLNLGTLKGNVGDQNYDLPADADLSAYQYVIIYCAPFSVVFSTAELMREGDVEVADVTMDDPMPEEAATEPVALRAGQFMDADASHRGSGSATIYELPGGELLLRFEDFNVTNGPALRVLLSTEAAPTRSSELGDYLDLGALKGNVGNQNYNLPAGTNLDDYQSIVIYCQPFHVIFSVATLAQ